MLERDRNGLIEYTMGELLEKWAAEQPNHPFMVYSDRDFRLSYSQFNERVDRLAKSFLKLGIEKDSKVGIWAKNLPDWLTVFFACAKVGAVLVTINTNNRSSELSYILKKADIHTLCIMDRYRGCDYVETMYSLVPELRTQPRGELRSEAFPELKNVVYIGQEKHRGMYNISELLLVGHYCEEHQLLEAKKSVGTHDVVNMQFTSGTTGFPKGVLLSHHNILNCGLYTGEFMEFTAEDRLLACIPMFHCFGCVLALCAVITHGSTMVMVEDFSALNVLKSVEEERCTILYGVPTMFVAEVNHPQLKEFDLSSLRTGIMAGSTCPVELMNRVMEKMNCNLISVYGLTETSPGMTASRLTDSATVRATTVGQAYPGIEVRIIDPETGEECKQGEIGEVCCRGYNVMKGYYKDPEATAEVIDKEGFLHSGDLGKMDESGNYVITGRIKDMIIRGGENIYPLEIENFLYTNPGIESVEVVGLPSPNFGEQVGAFIKAKDDLDLSEEDISQYCYGKIARYKTPRYIFFVDEFPMTASGKVQKFKLRELGVEMLEKEGIEIY